MRVVLMSANAPRHNAVGNQVAEKVRFFQDRGARVRLLVNDATNLHAELNGVCHQVSKVESDGPIWDELRQADLIVAVYAQTYELLQYLPRLAGTGPRIVFDYLGVTPAKLWHTPHKESLIQSARDRAFVWCADHALTTSFANRTELLDATGFPNVSTTTLPLVVDTRRFHPGPHDPFLHQRLGIEGRILLFVGRLAGNKRVSVLIEALARLDDTNTHAVIVGDLADVYAHEAERCRTLARQLGVADRVHFVGQLSADELPRAYCSADVLVVPSLHEGFCVPVIEAMASGLPVVAARSTALPETIGDAGLTFTADDFDDLVCQLRRVLSSQFAPTVQQNPRRIAIVSFRFGSDIVGGAETSVRTMATRLQQAGHLVEVFTTCTTSESNWQNDVPTGSVTLDGLMVHRFPIDAHDSASHGAIVRQIIDADGRVSPDVERRYLEHSIHSTALINTLRQRRDEFDSIIAGPYLFGLTADIVREFGAKALVVPCFHDEAIGRLAVWPTLYSYAGGVLYHSPEEQSFAQTQLGVNHPNATTVGTVLDVLPREIINPCPANPYVVYCGRYSAQKNLPLLLEWMERYQAEKPDRIDVVLMGRGEVPLPSASWLRDLGRVDDAQKRAVLAGAEALVQLSHQESLSLVTLEAWAEGTPVIVHCDCAVLVGQVERSGGGVAVADYEAFAAALDDLCQNRDAWRQRGASGRAYVHAGYGSADDYVNRLVDAIDQVRLPIHEQMRRHGLLRAEALSRPNWQRRFAEFIEQILTQPARVYREQLIVEPLRDNCNAVPDGGTMLLPVRFSNGGTHTAAPDGPGRTIVRCAIETNDGVAFWDGELPLPAFLVPGQRQVAALPIAIPDVPGHYRIQLRLESLGRAKRMPPNSGIVTLTVGGTQDSLPASCASAFLDTVQETLPKVHDLQNLPDDYVDVSEGFFAPAKRWIKRTLLNNFKNAYVDVLARQQSQVNQHVVLMIQQLAECCAMLDHAISGLHHRLDGIEAKMEDTIVALGETSAGRAV